MTQIPRKRSCAESARAPVGWAKERQRRAHHPSSSRPRDGGTLSLCPPYGLAHALSTSLRAQRSNPSFCARGGNGLLRCARNDDVEAVSATNWHEGQITSDYQKSCQASESKILCFRSRANHRHNSARLTRLRGARERHERAVRCDGRRWRDRRTRRKRTAKSCGSGAAVLALSLR